VVRAGSGHTAVVQDRFRSHGRWSGHTAGGQSRVRSGITGGQSGVRSHGRWSEQGQVTWQAVITGQDTHKAVEMGLGYTTG